MTSFASLDRLADAAEALSRVPALASLRAAREIEDLIQDEFTDGKDPYGTAWEPLAEATLAKGRFWPPLTDTGAMRGSLNVYATGTGSGLAGGVSISIDHPALPHQTGWSGPVGEGPARPILPDHGAPPSWDAAIEQAVTDAIDEEIGRGLP